MTTVAATGARASGSFAATSRPASAAPTSVVRAKGADAYSAMVRRIALRYSVEWKLVMAIIASESGGDPHAVSPAGAVGLMQLMPDTATTLGVDPWDPEQNVDGAVRYLSSLLSTFGSVDLTLIAYNAGPGFAMRYREGGVELGAETRAFLVRVGELLN
jgi:soluble lytic murein transglycosylase-like protein